MQINERLLGTLKRTLLNSVCTAPGEMAVTLHKDSSGSL